MSKAYRARSPGFRFVAWCLTAQIVASTFGLTAAAAATVRVPGGTPVIVQLNETASTENKAMGDNVRATVAADVTVAGTVVIRAGSPVTAVITHLKKPGMVGAPGAIGLDVTAVQGVTGEMIRVVPQSASGEGDNKQTTSLIITIFCCVLALLMKGGHAEIPPGTTLSTQTAQETNMEL